jgi:tetratricopeptide (TPR) repeat protein
MVYAYYGRGTAYIELEQYERAIDDYNKAIELDPNCADVYYNRDLAIGKLKKQKLTPGFEAVFAITGFLAVAYLLKSRKSNGGSKGSL